MMRWIEIAIFKSKMTSHSIPPWKIFSSWLFRLLPPKCKLQKILKSRASKKQRTHEVWTSYNPNWPNNVQSFFHQLNTQWQIFELESSSFAWFHDAITLDHECLVISFHLGSIDIDVWTSSSMGEWKLNVFPKGPWEEMFNVFFNLTKASIICFLLEDTWVSLVKLLFSLVETTFEAFPKTLPFLSLSFKYKFARSNGEIGEGKDISSVLCIKNMNVSFHIKT